MHDWKKNKSKEASVEMKETRQMFPLVCNNTSEAEREIIQYVCMRHNAQFKGHLSRKGGAALAVPAAPLLTAMLINWLPRNYGSRWTDPEGEARGKGLFTAIIPGHPVTSSGFALLNNYNVLFDRHEHHSVNNNDNRVWVWFLTGCSTK